MLTIYDTANEIRFQTPINIGSKRVKELMESDYVLLKFSVSKPIYFQLGDWCDVPGNGRFELVELYNPTYNKATGGYDYELELEAYYCKWRNKIFKYTPESGGREASWSLTATLDVHLGVFVRNLKALGYLFNGQEFIFSIDETVEQSAKLLTYNNTDMISALNMMAEAWNCEWWIEDHVIYFGRCEFGTPVDFEQGVNVDNISPSGNKNVYATRIYAFGSTRNIPVNYRPADESIVVNGIAQKRLMLPAGIPCVDAYPNMPTEAAVESVVVFDDVYPRTDGTVDSVDTYTDTVTNDDGTTNTETFYRFKDNSIKFSKDYILENEELHIIFQSGSLNGLDFGVMFNPLGVSEKLPDGSWNPDAQVWEIVANEDYGRKLPDTVLMPKVGDKYVLYGWDATKIASLGLIDTAEQELLEKTNEYIAKTKIDPNSYPCTMMSDWMKERGQTPTGYYFPFGLGDRVKLISDAYFIDGNRQSRIIGYEYPLDYPYDSPIITVGESPSTSRIGALEETVESLTLKGQTYVGDNNGNGSSIYIIGTNDTTTPTNRNTFSALRSLKEFISKTKSDRTPYGLSVGGTLTAEDLLQSRQFIAGLMGWRIDQKGNMEVESGVFRSFAQFAELIVNRLTAVEGDQIMTEGDTIETVTDNGDGSYTLKLHEKWDGYFTAQIEHNVIKGIYNNITQGLTPGEGQQTVNNAMYYTSWMNVISVDPANNEITVILYPDEETPAGRNFPPEPMMKIARWGNSGDSEDPRYLQRQQCLYLSSTEGRVVKLFRVTKPIIDAGNIAASFGTFPEFLSEMDSRIKPGDDGIYVKTIAAQTYITMDYQGRPVPTTIDRGAWTPGERYYDGTEQNDSGQYERSLVWYNGHGWLCNSGGVATAANIPAWNTTYWTHAVGDRMLHIEFNEVDSIVDLDNPECPLSVKSTYIGDDVTRSPSIYYDWTRKSHRNGAEDTASDALWNENHRNFGPSAVLTAADMNFQFGAPPEKLVFTVTAHLHDPNNPNLQPEEAQLFMI